MFNIFKKKEKEESNELIEQWAGYCINLGLTESQSLGLAYFNAALPTVLSVVNQNRGIIAPLSKVVKELGNSSSSEANALYLYREIYFNAKARNAEITPIELEGLPDGFFDTNDKFVNLFDAEGGMLVNSRMTVLMIDGLGKILTDYNINLEKAFELGHVHSNFFLQTNSGSNYAQAVIMSNTLPQYIASAIEIIPNPNSLALHKDLWMFSKILYAVLTNAIDDGEFSEWIWYYHNAIFYENKVGSTNIKSGWSLFDSNFEVKMLKEVVDTLPGYYKAHKNIGMQPRSIGVKFEKWEEFFPLLNAKMMNEYNIQSPTTEFINTGELYNYLAFKFIAAIQTILEHGDFEV
jgi:hypothetical protein